MLKASILFLNQMKFFKLYSKLEQISLVFFKVIKEVVIFLVTKKTLIRQYMLKVLKKT
jgi:hypothetical protein